MNIFKKIPGYGRPGAPPGVERTILHWAPAAALLGVVGLLGPSFLGWLQSGAGDADAYAVYLVKHSRYAAGALFFYINVLVMVVTGAIIIKLMKGPGYVADAYPLSDADRPRPGDERARKKQ